MKREWARTDMEKLHSFILRIEALATRQAEIDRELADLCRQIRDIDAGAPIPTEALQGRRGPTVYFAYSAARQLVKIGYTTNLDKRIQDLRGIRAGVSDLALLGAVRGGMRLERECHELFADHRETGEWFHATPEVLEVIESLTGGRVQA